MTEKIEITKEHLNTIRDKCPCKCEAYDVGIQERFYDGGQPVVIGQTCICGDCGQYVISDGVWWIAKSRFAPIATQEEMESLNKQEVITHNNER